MPSTGAETAIPAPSTADFLLRCARSPDRFFYPCNAKHREPRRCSFSFHGKSAGHSVTVSVDECEYGEGGTGWRVWPCALLLACWLAANDSHLGNGSVHVLEIGCGLGLPGLTAAALGAERTVLSDCLPVLLRKLCESVHSNSEACRSTTVAMLDWDMEVPSMASSAETADEQFSTEQGIKSAQLASEPTTTSDRVRSGARALESAPRLDRHETFDLLLASDVVYSMRHAHLLPAVVRGRLRTGGRFAAMVPVRSEAHTRRFLCGLLAQELRVLVSRVDSSWIEGVTSVQRARTDGTPRPTADMDASEWTQLVAANGKPFWHHHETKRSIWTDPAHAAQWRQAAVPFTADMPLREGEILFVDALLNEQRR